MNYILAAHGRYALETLASCQMIVGELPHFKAIHFSDEMSIADVQQQYDEALQSFAEEETIIVVDIQGGTPCNAAMLMSQKYKGVKIVSGLSLGLILPLAMGEELSEALMAAKNGLKVIDF